MSQINNLKILEQDNKNLYRIVKINRRKDIIISIALMILAVLIMIAHKDKNEQINELENKVIKQYIEIQSLNEKIYELGGYRE